MRIILNTKSLILWAGSAALALFALPAQSFADRDQACVQALWPAAKAAGIKRETFDRAFKGFTSDPEVVEQANYQPEYVKPIGEYMDRLVSDKRIETGKQRLAENQALLGSLETRYGGDPHVIFALWGVESNYGTQPRHKKGNRSPATPICTGTKPSFGKVQLIAALKILQHGDISLEAMNGSWAGAMGHTQFIPTTYATFAVDQDGDGKRDIWGNIPDSLASTANYLKRAGWQSGQSWGYEVVLPKGFDLKRVSENTPKPLSDWQRMGIVRVNGESYPRPSDKASLFAPEGTRGPSFLLLNNFRAILHYNVAKSYALAVGHLSDRLRGGGPFVHSWPTDETHLSLEQRTEFQRLLIAHGLMTGEPHGVTGRGRLGPATPYRLSKGLGFAGFQGFTLLKRLQREPPPANVEAKPTAEGQPANVGQDGTGGLAPSPEGPTSVPKN